MVKADVSDVSTDFADDLQQAQQDTSGDQETQDLQNQINQGETSGAQVDESPAPVVETVSPEEAMQSKDELQPDNSTSTVTPEAQPDQQQDTVPSQNQSSEPTKDNNQRTEDTNNAPNTPAAPEPSAPAPDSGTGGSSDPAPETEGNQ